MADTQSTAKFIIYGLYDPRDGALRYIGKSVRGLSRAHDHHYRACSERTYKAAWIRGLAAAGLRPVAQVLEECADKFALSDRERWWIAKERATGSSLTNLTDGGDGCPGSMRSQAAKDATGAKLRGRIISEQQRRQIAAAQRGRSPSPETRAKMSASHIGRKQSAEAIAKSAAARSGVKRSAEICAKYRLSNSGRTLTDEHRRRLSLAGKGQPKSLDWRARASAIRLSLPDDVRCRKHTAEARAKMSRAHQIRLAKAREITL